MDLKNPIASGNTADIYRDGSKAIKIFHAFLPDSEAWYEAKKQIAAFGSGLPVPRILDVTHIGGKPAIIMEYVEGPTFLEQMQREPQNAESLLRLSVDLQRDVHSKKAPSLEFMRDRLISQLQAVPQLDADCRSALLGRLMDLPAGDRLCHGDFHVQNLIRSQKGPVIIDWVTACCGSPDADACRTYLLYTNFSQELADAYLRIFCEISGCAPGDILVWLPILSGARLCEHVSGENEARLLKTARQCL